jgi:phosphonate transport system substrate-binding protein
MEKRRVQSVEPHSDNNTLRIAIGAMITPQAGFAYYKRLLDYMGEKMSMEVAFIDKDSYAEINNLLEKGEIDAAFVCSGPYVDGHEKFGLELLVVPQAYGETVYYSYIIVNAEGPVKSLEGLRGKTFAFTDPKSNTGRLVPTYMLSEINETPDSFFKEHTFTYAHDKSVEAVAMGLVDGAAVDSLIWEYLDRTSPEITSKTRVILKSQPFAIPPFAVRPGLDPEIKKTFKKVLLGSHKTKEGREILDGMSIDRFVEGNDSDYDSIRKMKSRLSSRKE